MTTPEKADAQITFKQCPGCGHARLGIQFLGGRHDGIKAASCMSDDDLVEFLARGAAIADRNGLMARVVARTNEITQGRG